MPATFVNTSSTVQRTITAQQCPTDGKMCHLNSTADYVEQEEVSWNARTNLLRREYRCQILLDLQSLSICCRPDHDRNKVMVGRSEEKMLH